MSSIYFFFYLIVIWICFFSYFSIFSFTGSPKYKHFSLSLSLSLSFSLCVTDLAHWRWLVVESQSSLFTALELKSVLNWNFCLPVNTIQTVAAENIQNPPTNRDPNLNSLTTDTLCHQQTLHNPGNQNPCREWVNHGLKHKHYMFKKIHLL